MAGAGISRPLCRPRQAPVDPRIPPAPRRPGPLALVVESEKSERASAEAGGGGGLGALIAILLPRLGQGPRQSFYSLDAVAYTRDKSLDRICLDQPVLVRLCSLEHESRCSGTGRGS
jgi:hypothetical protein